MLKELLTVDRRMSPPVGSRRARCSSRAEPAELGSRRLAICRPAPNPYAASGAPTPRTRFLRGTATGTDPRSAPEVLLAPAARADERHRQQQARHSEIGAAAAELAAAAAAARRLLREGGPPGAGVAAGARGPAGAATR